MGQMAGQSIKGLTAALRELVEPHVFFEALGVRYAGPLDGHDVGVLEQALRRAATWPGPIVLHVLTRKGKGYGPAEDDEVQCLHDFKAQSAPLAAPGSATDSGALVTAATPRAVAAKAPRYDEAFSAALLEAAVANPRIVAITAAMPGPTGLLPMQARFPERFLDVGIAEQHAMTAAAGMALGGLRPVVAVYSTFLSRCFDQENLDVGLHQVPVVICADRAGITGDDGPSHHGVLDMVLGLAVPGLSIFAPSEPAEIAPMLSAALELPGPALIRWPKTPSEGSLGAPGEGLTSRCLLKGDGEVVFVGVGKMAGRCLAAAELLAGEGVAATVHDLRVVRPADPQLVEIAARASLVVTAEDGLAHGGAGAYFVGLVAEAAQEAGRIPPRQLVLGIPTRYLPHAKPDEILHQLGLDAVGIAASTRQALGSTRTGTARREHLLASNGVRPGSLARGGGAPSRTGARG
jgi:1-deoxy-D-xylulose-5-phosphate synthase